MLKTVRDRVKKQMDEGKTVEEIIKSDPMAGFEKRGVGVSDFVRVVYNSLLKTKQ